MINKYTVSLNIAKALKEVGIEIKTSCWWVSVRKGESELYYEEALGLLECTSPYAYKRVAPAPTLGELMRELPEDCFVFFQLGSWWCFESIRAFERGEEHNQIEANTPEDAAGLMLLKIRKRLK